MKEKRRDNKGRILHTGESQRTDGKYLYKYVDAFGNTKYVYAWRLTPSRWKTCRFWERFLGAVEVLKLQVPKLHNSLEETQQWLTEGGVISAVKSFYFLEEHDALGGLEKVGTMLDKARYSNSLSSKLTAHLQRIDRTDLIPYIQYDTKHGKGGI
ncbi:integrase Tn1549-like, CTn4-Orf34 [Clostridioides difficile]|nr:integrase Tn1549-like, CTn4-Orf34 [Clostridioides difficile]